ncbi:DUF4349 domain-containing protein [Proteiniborus sp. MB09-C3]|uniref:DUF4349 domain-containing protein n=1 Tax=Proteiniborus sp. MB09-C3 TaxID=3050072 RepID=UPI0025547FB4|nr:DUF4349 domain-containing protein [Proteiniborus sp. MB09-C3]WIV10517.1 DUF4349 domain-containing protein [Proteiniborus sp. MB09-C3]
MNCNDFIDNISSYIDNEMTEIEKKDFELHISKCDSCRQEYECMISILKNVNNQEQVELPDNYRLELRRKLKETAQEKKTLNWRVISSIAAGLIVMIISISMFSDKLPFIGGNDSLLISPKSESPQENIASDKNESMGIMEAKSMDIKALDDNTDEETDMAMKNLETDKDQSEGVKQNNDFGVLASRSSLGNNRKSIKEAYLSIDLDELGKVQEQIINHVEENGGFVESINIESNEDVANAKQKSHLMKIRIPAEKFDKTLDFLKELGTLVDERLTHNDVTEKYNTIEDNLKNLYEQEDLLLEILSKAEDSNDKLLIEEEIKKVKEGINSQTSALEEYESSITLPTINTRLNEAGESNN